MSQTWKLAGQNAVLVSQFPCHRSRLLLQLFEEGTLLLRNGWQFSDYSPCDCFPSADHDGIVGLLVVSARARCLRL